jgi:hypothetical protein
MGIFTRPSAERRANQKLAVIRGKPSRIASSVEKITMNSATPTTAPMIGPSEAEYRLSTCTPNSTAPLTGAMPCANKTPAPITRKQTAIKVVLM